MRECIILEGTRSCLATQGETKKPQNPSVLRLSELDASGNVWCPGEDSNLHSVATTRT